MNMVRHDAIGDEVIFLVAMMVKVFANDRGDARIGQPLNTAIVIEITIIFGEI